MSPTLRTYGSGATTTIKVESWPDERGEYYVTSSQVLMPDLDAWTDSDADLISNRLADGGKDKGRVLFVWQDKMLGDRCAVSAALLHLEGQKPRYQLRRIVSVEDYKRSQSRWAVDCASILLSCVHQLAVKAGEPNGCIDWLFDNRQAAEDAMKRFGVGCTAQITSPLGRGHGRAQRAQIKLRRCLLAQR